MRACVYKQVVKVPSKLPSLQYNMLMRYSKVIELLLTANIHLHSSVGTYSKTNRLDYS